MSPIRIALCLALLLATPQVALAQLSGRVVAVADGDTLTILDDNKQQHRIRLADIDAPEGGQPFGNRSKAMLADLCHGKSAKVQVRETDRYGRTVGTVVCDGADANAALVRHGLAWVYVRYAPAGSPLYPLEALARSQRKGLWADAEPVAPWEWRRGVRSGQEALATQGTVLGNRRSMVYHLPQCPGYHQVSPRNQVQLESERAAKEAGYRKARNCA